MEYYIKFIKDQKLCYNKRRRHRKIFNICEEKFVTLRLLGYPDWSQTNLLILSSLRQIRAMNTLEYPILYRETRGLQEYISVFFIFGWTGWRFTSDNVFSHFKAFSFDGLVKSGSCMTYLASTSVSPTTRSVLLLSFEAVVILIRVFVWRYFHVIVTSPGDENIRHDKWTELLKCIACFWIPELAHCGTSEMNRIFQS